MAAAGAPALASGATFVAFGATAAGLGISLDWALAASALVYGMAGQMVLFEAPVAGGVAAALGASAANARFLPMAVSLAPWLGRRRALAVPFLAVTPWAAAMRTLPGLPEAARLRWFLGFGFAAWALGLIATVLGYRIAPLLDPQLQATLLVANPLYFGLLLAQDLRRPVPRSAILGGVVAAPLALLLPPGWGLIVAGLVGGSMAFAWGRRRGRA